MVLDKLLGNNLFLLYNFFFSQDDLWAELEVFSNHNKRLGDLLPELVFSSFRESLVNASNNWAGKHFYLFHSLSWHSLPTWKHFITKLAGEVSQLLDWIFLLVCWHKSKVKPQTNALSPFTLRFLRDNILGPLYLILFRKIITLKQLPLTLFLYKVRNSGLV